MTSHTCVDSVERFAGAREAKEGHVGFPTGGALLGRWETTAEGMSA